MTNKVKMQNSIWHESDLLSIKTLTSFYCFVYQQHSAKKVTTIASKS